VQGERLGRPARRQVIRGWIGHERKHEEWIEGRPELARLSDVVWNRIPEKELRPRFGEELVTELVDGVGKERRDQDAFGGPEARLGGGFVVKQSQTAVLELAATAARARVVSAECCRHDVRAILSFFGAWAASTKPGRRTTRAINPPRILNAFSRVCPKSVGLSW
jgi:hypothetical protein